MFAGIDFPSAFNADNFNQRRANGSAGVAYDPESLLTGEEIAAGFTYDNSKRNWYSAADYQRAITGEFHTSAILRLAPRKFFPPLPVIPAFSQSEHVESSIVVGTETYLIVYRPFSGLRVRHGGFVEWPILNPITRTFGWASYSFNGEQSGDIKSIPSEVAKATETLLRSRLIGNPSDIIAGDV